MENAPVQHVVVVKSGALSLRHSVQSRRTNRRGNDQNSYGEDYEEEEDIADRSAPMRPVFEQRSE